MLDLSRLRQTAEAANPNDWGAWLGRVLNDNVDEESGTFIQTFDPVLVLELLNRIETAEAELLNQWVKSVQAYNELSDRFQALQAERGN